MRRRTLKFATLVVCGGFFFQIASCAPIILQFVAQQLLSTALSALVSSAVDNGSTADNSNDNSQQP